MDLNSIDALLQRYSAAEGRIGANLHELDNHSTYQILRTDELRGHTATQLGRAFAKAPLLWEYFAHLQSVLSRAHTLRGDKPSGAERRQLEQLLAGRSVTLGRTNVPLRERDLMGSAEATEDVTIDELLKKMRLAYEPIRDGVAEVESILRSILPRLDAADTTLKRAKDEADLLGIVEPELSEAMRQLERFRRLSLDDPLSIKSNAGDDFDRQVRLAAGRVAEMKKGRDELHGDMGAMGGLIAEIRTLRARAATSREETMVKIASPIGLVHVPAAQAIDGPNGLAASADAMLAESHGSWQRQRQAVDDWLTRARKLRKQLRRAELANNAGMRQRDELRGLLRAYRAKMAGVGKAEDIALREIADEAHNELYTAPTDLARAEKLVRKFGESLRPGGTD